MSQPPYQPPQHQPYTPPAYPQPYAYAAPIDPMSKFRRASILMFVLAGVIILFAGCMGLMSRLPFDELPAESQQQLQQMSPEFTPELLAQALLIAAVMFFVPGVALIVTGIGLRSGKRGWVVASLVVVSLILVLLGFSVLSSLVQVARNPSAICSLTLVLIPAALFVLLFVWLLGCYKAADSVQARGGNWQQQPGYWQYPQQQQPYPPQGGYGYGYPQQQQPPPPSQYGTAQPQQPSPRPPSDESSRPQQ